MDSLPSEPPGKASNLIINTKDFLSKISNKAWKLSLPPLLNIILEVVARPIWQKKEIKDLEGMK